MRIVYVLTSLGMGGAERQVMALAGRMAGRGHTVALMVLRPRAAGQWPPGLPVIHLEMRKTPGSVLAAMARGRRFLKSFGPDLVHSHSFHANLAARLLKSTLPGLPVVSTVHNVYEGGWPRMLAYRLTDGLVCCTTAVCHAAADRFVALKAIPRRKCVVVSNGIDTAESSPRPERRKLTRESLTVDAQFIWLATGRIAKAKDYPNLLRAFRQVLEVHPESRLWVAGDGEAAEVAATRALADALGLRKAVRWLGLRRDVPALLDAADGFVLASAWEGMPLAVGEAMAMEKPVAATDVGGVRELVGDAGVLTAANAPDALATAMLAIMERTPEERRTLGRAARERIVQVFAMDSKTDEWEALYRRITGE
jgi:glycosyltransferase involved in cell wall biosynthesis